MIYYAFFIGVDSDSKKPISAKNNLIDLHHGVKYVPVLWFYALNKEQFGFIPVVLDMFTYYNSPDAFYPLQRSPILIDSYNPPLTNVSVICNPELLKNGNARLPLNNIVSSYDALCTFVSHLTDNPSDFVKSAVFLLTYVAFEKCKGEEWKHTISCVYEQTKWILTEQTDHLKALYKSSIHYKSVFEFLINEVYSAKGVANKYPLTLLQMATQLQMYVHHFVENSMSLWSSVGDVSKEMFNIPGMELNIQRLNLEMIKEFANQLTFNQKALLDPPHVFVEDFQPKYIGVLQKKLCNLKETSINDLTQALKKVTLKQIPGYYFDDVVWLGPSGSDLLNNKQDQKGYKVLLDAAALYFSEPFAKTTCESMFEIELIPTCSKEPSGLPLFKVHCSGWGFGTYFMTNDLSCYRTKHLKRCVFEFIHTKNEDAYHDSLLTELNYTIHMSEVRNVCLKYRHEVINPNLPIHVVILDVDINDQEQAMLFHSSHAHKQLFYNAFVSLILSVKKALKLKKSKHDYILMFYTHAIPITAKKIGIRIVINFGNYCFMDSKSVTQFVDILELMRLHHNFLKLLDCINSDHIFDKAVYTPGHSLRCCLSFKEDGSSPLIPFISEHITTDLWNKKYQQLMFNPMCHLFHFAGKKENTVSCICSIPTVQQPCLNTSKNITDIAVQSSSITEYVMSDVDQIMKKKFLKVCNLPTQLKQEDFRFVSETEHVRIYKWGLAKFQCIFKKHNNPKQHSNCQFEVWVTCKGNLLKYKLKQHCWGKDCRFSHTLTRCL